MTSNRLRGVIFDLGSTLIDFKGDYDEVIPIGINALADFLRSNHLHFHQADFIQHFDLALRSYHNDRDEDCIEKTTFAILQEVLPAFVDQMPDDQILREALARMYAVSEAYWEPKSAMRPVLDQLSEAGYRLGLLSNAGDEANVQRLITKAAIRDYFDPILISAAVGIRKPDPRPFEMILNQWGLSPFEVVMVGDTLEADILGAQRAGVHQIWLRDAAATESPDPSSDIQPERITEDLADVPALVEAWDHKGLTHGV